MLFTGPRHKLLSRIFVLALVPLGIFYWHSWLVWAALLFFFGLRHPAIYDATKLDKNRVALGLTALAIFLLTFTLVPPPLRRRPATSGDESSHVRVGMPLGVVLWRRRQHRQEQRKH